MGKQRKNGSKRKKHSNPKGKEVKSAAVVVEKEAKSEVAPCQGKEAESSAAAVVVVENGKYAESSAAAVVVENGKYAESSAAVVVEKKKDTESSLVVTEKEKDEESPAAVVEKEVKSVYVCLNRGKGQTCRWYNLENRGEGKGLNLQEASLVPHMEEHPEYKFYGCGVAFWDSKIYFMGGVVGLTYELPIPLQHNKVQIFDVNSKTWTGGIPMEQERSYTTAVAISGKIYVFGSYMNHYVTIEEWAQCFDISTNTWKRLCSPPRKLYDGYIPTAYAVHDRKTTIYFWHEFPSAVYSYNYVTDIWMTITDDDPLSSTTPWNYKPAVVGDFLYWTSFQDEKLHAFDLSNNQELNPLSFTSPPMGSHVDELDILKPQALVYLGKGILCLIALETDEFSKLYCLTFRVDETSQTARLAPLSDDDANGSTIPRALQEPLYALSNIAIIT